MFSIFTWRITQYLFGDKFRKLFSIACQLNDQLIRNQIIIRRLRIAIWLIYWHITRAVVIQLSDYFVVKKKYIYILLIGQRVQWSRVPLSNSGCHD